MKVLVTGATGFIGRHVVPALRARGADVVATALEADASPFPWLADADYRPYDLADASGGEDLFARFGSPDLLVHLAWEGLPRYRERFHFESNLPRHYAFLKNLVEHGLADVTVAGTCFEYGLLEGCLTEDLPGQPDNAYALAKDTLRRFLLELRRTLPFCLKWPRLFYLYGPGQSPRTLLAPTHVEDRLVRVEGVINCCSGQPISVKDLVLQHLARRSRTIALNLGYYPYPDFEPLRFWGSTAKYDTIPST